MPDPLSRPVLTVLGAGRLGRTLARLWHDRRVFAIGEVVASRRTSAEQATDFIGTGRPRAAGDPLAPVQVGLIAVPDDRLGEVAAQLAESAPLAPQALLFHCSGALGSGELAPLRERGALVASVHPMHSFADPARSLTGFAGTACALEGDAAALDRLVPAFAAIGGRPLLIHGEAKLLYHAAGVFASNYVTVLLDAALRLLDGAGVAEDDARRLLEPLVYGAVESALELGPGSALTGPVARGDAALVARQAAAVAGDDAARGALYRALAEAATALAEGTGRLDPQRVQALRTALDAAAQPESMRTPTTQSVAAKP